MKAAYTRYGPPDVVEVSDLDKPVPRDNEVLIKVRAASVNPLDWKTMTGGPFIVRILLGLRKPKIKQLGVDVAGEIEAVGRNVTKFRPGDAVFGTCRGAFAEYACTSRVGENHETCVVMKPDNVTFEQAALHRLRDSPHCRVFATKDGFSQGRRSLSMVQREAWVRSPYRSPSRSAQM